MKKILLGLALLFGYGAQAQFVSTPPVQDGTITAAEYGNYTNIGTNGWFVAWDNTYLYLGKTGGSAGEPVIFAADLDPMQPVSGGTSSNGNLFNRNHFDHTSQSPFRTDISVYWTATYIEYWERNGSGDWNQQLASSGILDRGNSGTNRECRIRWSDINGTGGTRPSSFNWYGYAFNPDPFGSPGFDFFYDVFPNGVNNPSGNQNGTNPRFFFYQSVPSTASGSASNPMSTALRSFETRVSYSYTNIGTHPSSLHDMTINTSSAGDLDFQTGVTITGSLVAGSPTSNIRSGSGLRTVTFTGSNGVIRNAGGTFFGEFGGNSLYFTFAGNTTLAGSSQIDCRSFTVNAGATLDIGNVGINCNNNTGGGDNGIAYINGSVITSDPDGLYGSTVTAIRSTFTAVNLGPVSTVNYNGTGQTVDARAYGSLTISGSGTKTLASGTTSIGASDVLTVASGSTFNMGGNAVTFNTGATASISGTVQTSHANGLTVGSFGGLSAGSVTLASGSTVQYTSASAQTVSPLTYHNLTLNGGATDNMGGNVTTNGALTLTSGSLAIGANTLTINGAFSGNATNALTGNGSSNLTLGSSSTGNLFFLSGANAINNYTSGRATTLGNAMEVRGLLSQNSGALTTGGFLTIGSGATYQGQVNFAAAGSISGNVTSQRYISGINNAWRGFSAPVAANYSDISPTIDLGVQGVNGSNLITLRDMNFWTGAAWERASNWRIAADTGINATPSSTIAAGRGFLAYGGSSGIANLASPVTIDLTGTLNSTTISAPGRVNSNRSYNGWMLMGNPYLATLDWENMFGTADVAHISSTIYLYNTTYGSWDSYNATTNTSTGSGTNLIAPYQAFMVKATSATVPTLNFRTSHTSNAASVYNFRQQSIFPIVRLKVTQNNKPLLSAMSLVASQATAGLDEDYDSQFPGSFNGVSFYSMTSGDFKLVQNSRPMTTSGISEDYYFEFNGAGNYRIEPNLENVDPFWTIMLEDKITGLMHNLRAGGYAFTHQATNRKDRFVLHINAMTTATNNVSFVKPSMFVNNGTLVVNFDRQQEPTTIEVLDLNGRLMKAAYQVVESVFSMDLNDLANAPYLVRFTAPSGISTEKVVLNK